MEPESVDAPVPGTGDTADWYRLLELSPDGIFVMQDGYHVFANPQGIRFLGGEVLRDIQRQPCIDFMHPEERFVADDRLGSMTDGRPLQHTRERIVRLDGEIRYIESAGGPIEFRGRPAALAVIRDVTEQVRAENELEAARSELARQAAHDDLTGLPNRPSCLTAIGDLLASGRLVCVLFCDLDRFKHINDALGHDVGDRVLVATADRLRAAVRRGDVVTRLGGDEFVVICPDLATDEAEVIAARLHESLHDPIVIDEGRFGLSVSIGIAAASTGDAHDLLRRADTAMYRAKDGGRARTAIGTASDERRTSERIELERGLRDALDGKADPVDVAYQPLVDARTGRLVGIEALARWTRVGVPIRPDRFVAIAEDAGFVGRLDRTVRRQALRCLADWRERGLVDDDVVLSCNSSVHELSDGRLLDDVAADLRDAGVHPALLRIELTERSLIRDLGTARETMRDMVRLGVSFALDDFGRGQSSFALLADLDVVTLKLDRVFAQRMASGGSDRNAAIVQGVIALAHELGMITVVEGVEDEATAAAVAVLGADQLQGYGVGRPVPAVQLEQGLILAAGAAAVGVACDWRVVSEPSPRTGSAARGTGR